MNKLLATVAFALAAIPALAGTAMAHGCHRDPAVDRFGLHRHVGPYCERLDLREPRYEEREHRHYDRDHDRDRDRHVEHDRDHDHDRGPPQCVKKCHYVGPFKTCDMICR